MIEQVEASARTIATDEHESDGTLEWDSTTVVLARVRADGAVGLGAVRGNRVGPDFEALDGGRRCSGQGHLSCEPEIP